jgi:hypothetical protein
MSADTQHSARKVADRALQELMTASRSRGKWTVQADYASGEDFDRDEPCGYDVIEVESGSVKLRVNIAADGVVSFDRPEATAPFLVKHPPEEAI